MSEKIRKGKGFRVYYTVGPIFYGTPVLVVMTQTWGPYFRLPPHYTRTRGSCLAFFLSREYSPALFYYYPALFYYCPALFIIIPLFFFDI